MNDYKMELAIVQNPHLEAKEQRKLWDELNRSESPKSDSFDEQGFDKLIAVMKGTQGSKVKIKN